MKPGSTELTGNRSSKQSFQPQKPAYMKNSVEPRESRFNLTGSKTVDGCHGSCRFSDSEFFFFFFGYLQLSHWWSFNLRHWDCTTICSYSSFQSRSPSLSLSLCVFADGCFCFFFFVCVFFVCCFCGFSLMRFSFEPTESFGLFEGDWQLAFCHPLNASRQVSTVNTLFKIL